MMGLCASYPVHPTVPSATLEETCPHSCDCDLECLHFSHLLSELPVFHLSFTYMKSSG